MEGGLDIPRPEINNKHERRSRAEGRMKGELQKWVSSGVFDLEPAHQAGLGKFYFSLLLSLDLDRVFLNDS